MRHPPLVLLLALAVAAGGCSTVYYAAIAQLGWAKHDLLAHRIQLARDSQDQARIQFADALQLFGAAGDTAGAARVAALRASYEDCAASATLVRARRAAVEKAADAFFGEWHEDIGAASDTSRPREQQRYDTFHQHYDRLLAAMRDAEAAMPPVLDGMKAQLAALERGGAAPASPLRPGDGDQLTRSLQLAIALADQYIAELEAID